MYIYSYPFPFGPFSLGSGEGLDQIILEFFYQYQVCLAQVGHSIWRTVTYLHQLCIETGENLTLAHMINLYSLKIFRGGVLNLSKHGHRVLLTSVDDDSDHGWIERFVVATRDIIPTTGPAFPASWNCFHKSLGTSFLSS